MRKRWSILVIYAVIFLSHWMNAQAAAPASLGGEFTVNDLHCGQWERTYDGDWIAQGEATVDIVEVGNVSFRRVIVKDRASDLYISLEVFCRAELDGGKDYYGDISP